MCCFFTALVFFGPRLGFLVYWLLVPLRVTAAFSNFNLPWLVGMKRILAFISPEADPLGAGYNVLQSKVAIGSGGFFGKGFLKGTQTQLNFIPEQWTDFIFCVPGEEFGFLGASLVLLLFGLLLFRGLTIASISKNSFSRCIAAIGFVSILTFHVFVNIGMSMGLLPVVGIPLPYLSYGGSALVANMIIAGLFMNFYANRKEH